jgi:hypothetical protein
MKEIVKGIETEVKKKKGKRKKVPTKKSGGIALFREGSGMWATIIRQKS